MGRKLTAYIRWRSRESYGEGRRRRVLGDLLSAREERKWLGEDRKREKKEEKAHSLFMKAFSSFLSPSFPAKKVFGEMVY